MNAEHRRLEERPARRQGWEDHVRGHFATFSRKDKYQPMSPREAYLAGWRDRAEWGYQELPSDEELDHG